MGCSQTRCPERPVRPTVMSSWQVSSFSETKAQILQQKRRRTYASTSTSSHVSTLLLPRGLQQLQPHSPFWNAGCQMGGVPGPYGAAGLLGSEGDVAGYSTVAPLGSLALTWENLEGISHTH